MQIWRAVSRTSRGVHSVSWVNTSREAGRANQDQHECRACHEADERSAFRNPAAAHGRGHRNPGRSCERGAGQGGPRRTLLAAMRKVPRHRFVPSFLAPLAYQDTPLPIGFDKTISQPFIVALMTDLLGPEPHESIL